MEKYKIGGDCTWSGCVPSKALLKVAKAAHTVRTAAQYGIGGDHAQKTNMAQVRHYVQRSVAAVYRHETPEHLAREGIDVITGAAHFVDTHTIRTGQRVITAKKFVIATGAHPFVPPIPGIQDTPYLTCLQLFDNDHLPERLLVIGAGPIGVEMAQAYQRLGSQATLIDIGLLPGESLEVTEVMGHVFAREGIQFVKGLVTRTHRAGREIVLNVGHREVCGDMLLVAVGRVPNVNGLALENAGVKFSAKGIAVDRNLRTSVNHIFAVGDCVAGNDQFTHLAGWQGYKAVRNALLSGNESGFAHTLPRTTFTDPEVAHVGLTEAQARKKFGNAVQVTVRKLDQIDRAVVEDDRDGFIKVVHRENGKLLGATIVAARAGEMITEYSLALQRGLKMFDLANVIHVYPTCSMGTMRLAAAVETRRVMDSWLGRLLRFLARGRDKNHRTQPSRLPTSSVTAHAGDE